MPTSAGAPYGTQPATAEGSAMLSDGQRIKRFVQTQRRVAILAAMLAFISMVVLITTKLNPESTVEQARQDQRVIILEHTVEAIENVWEKQKKTVTVQMSVDSAGSTEKLLEVQGGVRGKRQMLSDIFTAPLDVASGLVNKILSSAHGQVDSDAVRQGLSSDGMITKVNTNPANYNDMVTEVRSNYQPSSGMVTNINSRGTVQPNGEVWTTPTLDVNGQPVSGSGAQVQAAPLYKVPGGFQTNNFVEPKPPSGFGVWSAPPGWEDGRADKQFSITIDTPCGVSPDYPCRRKGSAHLNLEVYCPPYKAPAHGSVWYDGKEYRDATLGANITNRRVWKVEGKSLPIAQFGDIAAGHQVRISCDAHYCLSDTGCELPKCLMSGEWEEGKTCEPIMCDAYMPPPHGVVVPARSVMAGEQVTIYCEEGYDEYYGPSETVGEAMKAGATTVKLAPTDPWFDYSRWFGGPNQGKKGNLISMEAGPQTALATVQALQGRLSGVLGGEEPESMEVKKSLDKVQKKLSALAKERRALQKRITLSQGITHMSAQDVDSMVESFVKSGGVSTSVSATPALEAKHHSKQLQDADEGRHRARKLLWEEEATQTGVESLDEIERLRKHPVCLDKSRSSGSVCKGHFEPGIYCKKRPPPVVIIPPPLPGQGSSPTVAPPPRRPRGGKIAPPRGRYIVPLVCPSYIAPDHGSVWFRGQQFRIATNAGIPATESVHITCHKHYKLSEIGSERPQCLPNGQWEVGKMCQPIYCADYGNLQYGYVSTHDYVRSGTRIQLTCHPWYQPAGKDHGATCQPMCLDDSTFEKGCVCVPRPCPIGSDCPNAGSIAAEGIEPKVSHLYVRDWEQEVQRPMSHDYNPNVFDQEPRPWTLDTPLDRYDTLLRPIDSRRVNYRDTTRSWVKWSPNPSSYDQGSGLWRARSGGRSVGAGGDRGFVEDDNTRLGGEPLGGSQTGNRGVSAPGATKPGGTGTWPNAPAIDRTDWEDRDD